MLVASIIGVDMRATMDIDTTVKELSLNEQDFRKIIEKICAIQIEANLDRLRQPFKIDISTDDVITPDAIEFKYKLMFEDRTISVLSYNLETLLAEKMQTILARGLANTRMRDFYDIYEIMNSKAEEVNPDVLKYAFEATCVRRGTVYDKADVEVILDKIKADKGMEDMWNRFRTVNYFVEGLDWKEIVSFVIGEMALLYRL